MSELTRVTPNQIKEFHTACKAAGFVDCCTDKHGYVMYKSREGFKTRQTVRAVIFDVYEPADKLVLIVQGAFNKEARFDSIDKAVWIAKDWAKELE